MNTLQEVLARNVGLMEEWAAKGAGTAMGRVSLALMKHDLAIVGPCAAQTPEQMSGIIDEIERTQPDATIMVRCCHDKPRSMELMADGTKTWNGIGLSEGVRILKQLKRRRPDLQLIAEIRHAAQLEELGPLLDAVWIGNREGRSTIQEVTAAAAKYHLLVFIKNSSVQGELGIKDMQERLISGLAAAAVIENERVTALNTIVIALLRGIPAQPTDPEFRNIPNEDWIPKLRLWSPNIPIVMDAGHIAKPDLTQPTGDPKAMFRVTKTIHDAMRMGANGFMTEITGSVPSRTDPGVPAGAFLEWLADLPLQHNASVATL